MTPGAIIALVRDVVLVAAVCLVLYFLVSYGKDVVKIQDMAAVQAQLKANSETIARWQKESTDADTKRAADLARLSGAIGTQRTPVYILRSPPAAPGPGTVSSHPAPTGSQPAGAGGTDTGSRSDPQPVDQRPQVNAYEMKFETALADCRAILDQWPSPKNQEPHANLPR